MDRIFKDKLEAYRPVFTEKAWADFAPQLSKNYWWKTWWGFTSISGILLLGLYLLSSSFTAETPVENPPLAESQSPALPAPLVADPKALPSAMDSADKDPKLAKKEQADPTSLKKTREKPLDSNSLSKSGKTRTIHRVLENKEPISIFPDQQGVKWKAMKQHSQSRHQYHYSDPELIRHLLKIDDQTLIPPSSVVKGPGDFNQIKEPLHWDVTVGPVVSWLYPVDGFSSTRLPYSEELFSWRFPGMKIALVVNQKWSLSAGVMGGNTVNYIAVGEDYPTENLVHFPDWSEVTYTVENIKVETRQLLLPLSLQYHQKVMGNFGMNFKAGLLAHRIGDQNFVYEKSWVASSLGLSTALSQDTWQLSYLQGGLGFSYEIGKRFSTYLEGEYWKGIQPIGGEQHKYHLMGVSIGVNYHLFPKE